MKKEPPEPQGQYTYADAMNQWAAGQDSYFRRVKAGIFHPGAAATGAERLLGYIWRAIFLGGVVAMVYWVMLKKHLKSEAFAEEMAVSVAEKIGAEEFTFTPFRWKDDLALTPLLSATGGEDSFFEKLNGTSFQFRSKFASLFKKDWEVRKISLGTLDITVRSGGIGFVPEMPDLDDSDAPLVIPSEFETPKTDIELDTEFDLETAPDENLNDLKFDLNSLDLKSGGLGIQPNFANLEFDEITVHRLTLRWGLSDFTRGLLSGSTARIWEEEETWNIEASGGTLTQNWIPPLQLVTPLLVQVSPGSITIEPTQVQLGQGSGTFEASISTGDSPVVNAVLALSNASLNTIVGDSTPIDSRLDFTSSGTAHFSGSTNTKEGIRSTIDLEIQRGTLRRIPVLEALALPTSHGAFRHLPILNGRLQAETNRGVLTVKSLHLVAQEVSLDMAFKIEEELFDGTLSVTVPNRMLKDAPNTKALGSPGTAPETTIFEFPLKGEIEELTKKSADAILESHRADASLN